MIHDRDAIFFFITKFAFQIILLKVYTCNASNELCRLLTYKMKKVLFNTYKYLLNLQDRVWTFYL